MYFHFTWEETLNLACLNKGTLYPTRDPYLTAFSRFSQDPILGMFP